MSADDVRQWSGKAKPKMDLWDGPKDVRDEFLDSMGIDFTASYLDPSVWIPQTRTIVPLTFVARDMLKQRCSQLCSRLGITVSDRRVLDG